MKFNIGRVLAVTGAALTMAVAFSGPSQANAAPNTLQQQIDDVLAHTKGGTQISDYEIAWNGGEVVMAFPLPGEAKAAPSSPAAQKLEAQVAGVSLESAAAAPLASDNCPTEAFGNDWYCFYEDIDWGGRRLAWNANHSAWYYFSDYDFVNKTSSWSNKGGLDIQVNNRSESGSDSSCWGTGGINLWWEDPHSHVTTVGGDNDKADCFKTY